MACLLLLGLLLSGLAPSQASPPPHGPLDAGQADPLLDAAIALASSQPVVVEALRAIKAADPEVRAAFLREVDRIASGYEPDPDVAAALAAAVAGSPLQGALSPLAEPSMRGMFRTETKEVQNNTEVHMADGEWWVTHPTLEGVEDLLDCILRGLDCLAEQGPAGQELAHALLLEQRTIFEESGIQVDLAREIATSLALGTNVPGGIFHVKQKGVIDELNRWDDLVFQNDPPSSTPDPFTVADAMTWCSGAFSMGIRLGGPGVAIAAAACGGALVGSAMENGSTLYCGTYQWSTTWADQFGWRANGTNNVRVGHVLADPQGAAGDVQEDLVQPILRDCWGTEGARRAAWSGRLDDAYTFAQTWAEGKDAYGAEAEVLYVLQVATVQVPLFTARATDGVSTLATSDDGSKIVMTFRSDNALVCLRNAGCLEGFRLKGQFSSEAGKDAAKASPSALRGDLEPYASP